MTDTFANAQLAQADADRVMTCEAKWIIYATVFLKLLMDNAQR